MFNDLAHGDVQKKGMFININQKLIISLNDVNGCVFKWHNRLVLIAKFTILNKNVFKHNSQS